MILARYRWLVCFAGFMLAVSAVCLTVSNRLVLVAVSDLSGVFLISCAIGVTVWNAISNRGQTRLFWALMAMGCFMWSGSQACWAVYEIWLRRPLPDPFPGDIVLFMHVIPMMAAVAFRPHRHREEQKIFTTLNFLMLMIWWIFLYAFIVFPEEYVALNVSVHNHNWDILYLVENVLLMLAMGLSTASASGAWKKVYRQLFLATALYTIASEAMNSAIARHQYYSGSLYDLPFLASLCWLIWAALLAHETKPASEPAEASGKAWRALAQRLAMVAILSLPLMGFWAIFLDNSPPKLRLFRLLVTLSAMLVLGICVFIRQFLLDGQLMRLLDASHHSLENLQRLQSQLVQKEKLASLGQLVAGAAHEINNPLAAILGYSELLEANTGLQADQTSMARKIAQQARRTRDLVSGLLSFAQQTPAEKTLLDIGSLVQRAVNMERLNLENRKVRLEVRLSDDLPEVRGNANQLFQCCLQIIGNAMDALDEVGGGTLNVSAYREAKDAIIEFTDSGPGIREPRRVFDPFYTTKPIGKGTGLGLSATYGVIQDHDGQVSCYNREQGGAVFLLRFPGVTEAALAEATAAKA